MKLGFLSVAVVMAAGLVAPGFASERPLGLIPVRAAATPPRPVDITNTQREFSTFLDVNGKTEEGFWFSVQGQCRLDVTPARGTGFTVGYAVKTTNGTMILRSLQGTNRVRSVELPTGSYQFVAFARRDAGSYTFTLATYCT